MTLAYRNLVLIHGLWDTPYVFSRLISYLCREELVIFAPHLPHDGGRRPLLDLAKELDRLIIKRFGCNTQVEILGFSMGGLIARTWLQKFDGAIRTRRYISVGCPQRGTFAAQFAPAFLFPGIADMKRGSDLIRELQHSSDMLKKIKCSSYFCRWDLMVIPGWQAVLPCGSQHRLPVLTHKDLILHPDSLKRLTNDILKC